MSVIQAGNTTTTSLIYTGDTTGNLVFTTGTANTVTLTIPSTGGIRFADNTTQTTAATSSAAPNVTTYTSGSGTYTTPAGAKWLQIQMVGGGGGGGGAGTGGSPGGTGGTGGTTTFGTSLLTCAGGAGGVHGGAGTGGGDGGNATISSPAVGLAVTGNRGGSYPGGSYNTGTIYTLGGLGAVSPLGTNIPSASTGGAGGTGGFSNGTSAVVGNGGGAGGYIQAIIASPSATYSYAIGAAGTAGAAGGGGVGAAAAGGAGLIYITAYF
jgi:hypothetical protein